MMVKAAPSAAFVVAEPDLLLEFEVIAFNAPAQLGRIDQALERDVGWQCGEPVMVRLGFALGPLTMADFPPACQASASEPGRRIHGGGSASDQCRLGSPR
jgi:hypothetical protein